MARLLSFVTSYLLESFRSRSNRGEVAFEVDVKSTASEALGLICNLN